MIKKLEDFFFGNKPLEMNISSYPSTMDLHYNKFELPKEIDLSDTSRCQRIAKKAMMVFGITGKEENLIKYDFLKCWDWGVLVVHKRILAKLEVMCPDDYETLPVLIKNYTPKTPAFENKDFILINVLHTVDAIDREKTEITYSKNGVPQIKNLRYKDNCMEGRLLARDSLIKSYLLFDPKLAREFPRPKGRYFWSPGAPEVHRITDARTGEVTIVRYN